MWQRFTASARQVVFYSQEEAQRLGEGYVSTEHLLLGITRDSQTTASRVLAQLGISLEAVRTEVEKGVARGDSIPSQDMTLTPRGKRVIDLAYEEARSLGDDYIGTEHLLLGLIREGEGLAGRVLAKLGARLDNARQFVRDDPEKIRSAAQAPMGSTAPSMSTPEYFAKLSFMFRARQGWRVAESLVQLLMAESHQVPAVLLTLGSNYASVLRGIEYGLMEEFVQGDEPPSPSLTDLFQVASEEARALESPAVTPDHMILALIVDGRSRVVQSFMNAGLTADILRAEIVRQQGA
jgi:ATP-dependent Clp protease ATP-binding subunit ClpA